MDFRVNIFKQLLHPWFIFFLTVFGFHLVARAFGFSHWLFNSYLNDFLAGPILLFLIQWTMRMLSAKPNFRLDRVMIFSFWILISVLFEYVLPNYYSRYTHDVADVVVYLLGCFTATLTTLHHQPA